MDARLSHVAVVVPQLEEACKFYAALTGAAEVRVMEIPELGLRNAFVTVGNQVYFEIIETFSGDPLRVLGEQLGHGEQMMCFECEDLAASVAALRADGHDVTELPSTGGTLAFDRAWVRRAVRGDFPMELVPVGAVGELVANSRVVAISDL